MALYPNLLGTSFSELAHSLQAFHKKSNALATGILEVRYASRWGRLMGFLMGLPKPGRPPVTLKVFEENGDEIWQRQFAEFKFVTKQRASQGLLEERRGPFSLYFKLSVDDGAMLFALVRATLFSIPLPLFFFPNVSAKVVGEPGGFSTLVQFSLWGRKPFCRYSGFLAFEA